MSLVDIAISTSFAHSVKGKLEFWLKRLVSLKKKKKKFVYVIFTYLGTFEIVFVGFIVMFDEILG